MIKVVIVDDEMDAVKSIELIIKEYCLNAQVVGTALSVTQAKREILKHQPDLVFLDIEMPRSTGFDLLEMLPQRDFELIFITAYNHFAIKAFKYSAIDYILKPIDIDEFVDAMVRVEKRVRQQNSATQEALNKKYDVFLDNIKSSKLSKISLPTSEGYVFLEVNDISRVEAEGSYSLLHTTSEGKILVSKNLKEFETLLADNDFFRTHNSYLINLSFVKKYVVKDGGYILMNDDTMVPISRRRKELFLGEMRRYIRT